MTGITNPTEEYFKDGGWGWDGTQWRKLALVFGYTDRWAEWLGETKSGDGQYIGTTVAVPAGYVYVCQMMFMRNNTGARGAAILSLYDGSNYYILKRTASQAQYDPLLLTGEFCLKAGDSVQLRMASCLNNDVIEAGVWGYKMAVA